MWSTQFHPNLVVNIPFTFGLAFLLPVQTLRWYRGSEGELVFWFVVEPPICWTICARGSVTRARGAQSRREKTEIEVLTCNTSTRGCARC